MSGVEREKCNWIRENCLQRTVCDWHVMCHFKNGNKNSSHAVSATVGQLNELSGSEQLRISRIVFSSVESVIP